MDNPPSTALIPQTTHEVSFYEDTLLVALVDDIAYVALRPITDFLGLAWAPQYQRIQRDLVLAEESRLVITTGADGRKREMFCLPLEYLPGWLFGINASRVKPELQEKIIRYQRECFRILWQAFQSKALTTAPDVSQAITQLSGEQVEIKARITSIEQSVTTIFSQFGLSPAHKESAQNAVESIRLLEGLPDPHSIWKELNAEFGVKHYYEILDEKWSDASKWLKRRHDKALKRKQQKGQQPSLFDNE